MERTVASVDMVGYSSIARLLEQNTGAKAVGDLNGQIQQFINDALQQLSDASPYTRIAETGDGVLVAFEKPHDAHQFAQQLHLNTNRYSANRSENTARRHFRIGIVTGEVIEEPVPGQPTHYAGIAISNAVRLQSAAQPAETVIDHETFTLLPSQDRALYGPETIVHGKREERFNAHRSTAGVHMPTSEKAAHQTHIATWVGALAAVVTTIVAVATYFALHRSSDSVKLLNISARPNSVHKGDRIAVTIGINEPAPPGGLPISLTVSDSSIITVDGNLVIFQGETSGTKFLEARDTPAYPDPIEIRAQYENQAVRTQVAIIGPAPAGPHITSPLPVHTQFPPQRLVSAPPSQQSQAPTAVPPAQKPLASLDPELLGRLEDAQARLAAENQFWNSQKKALPPGGSLRPEITSQIYAAESSSNRCTKDKETSNATALSACIESLNDHLTQLKIQH